MQTLNYDRLAKPQQQQVDHLIAELAGQAAEVNVSVRFVARGVTRPAGEYELSPDDTPG